MVAAARQARDEPAVHGSDCGIAGTRHVLHDPGELRGREVRIDHQPRNLPHPTFMAALAQPRALERGSPVLPDNGAGQRLKRGAIPNDQRLALVRDADRLHIVWLRTRRLERAERGLLDRRPYLLGVVLDPARLRVVLLDLHVSLAANLAVHADGDGGRTGRALVKAQDDSPVSHL